MVRKAAAAFLLAAVLALVAPAAALAADYRCAEVDLTATLETDGSASVVDQRIFEFEGASREVLKWLYEGFPEDAALQIGRVRMAPADEAGAVAGEWRELPEVTFELPWRDGGGPQGDAWAYDRFQHRLYAFVTELPARVVFEVTYTVEDAVVAYDDAADFQWLYVPRDYAVALDDVTATVVLPVAADDAVRPMDNVYAWGHGPADGAVDISRGGAITFTDPKVLPSQFAEARVLFPVDWLGNLSEEARRANQGNPQYSWTPRYEETWVDRSSYAGIIRLRLIMGLLALSAVVLAGALAAYARWGRERLPSFTADYCDEIPDRRLAPAVMGRLWRWNHESPDDVVATVLDMVRRGALTVRRDDEGRPAALVLLPDLGAEAASGETALDGATLRLLRVLADGADELSVPRLAEFARSRAGDFLRAEQAWQLSLTALVDPHGFFDAASRRAQHVVLVAAALLALAGVAALIFLGWAPGLLALAAAGAAGVLANYTMRRSPEGNDITARAKALRNWLRDGGLAGAGDAMPAGRRAELVIYAYLFDVLDAEGDGGDGRSGDGPCVPATPAATLAYLAPRLTRAFDDALRVAHHRAEVTR